MRLAIRHISRFRFDEQAVYALQRLRLRPQSGPGQTVRAWQITIDGVEPMLSYIDGLGNGIDLVRHDRGRNEITIIAAGVVETQDRAGIVGNPEGYAPPWVFERLAEGSEDQANPTVAAVLEALPADAQGLDALHALMAEVHQLPAEALRGEAGLDAPGLFIAAARHLRIPSRYVTGYLANEGLSQRMAETMSQVSGASVQVSAQPSGRDKPVATQSAVAAAGLPHGSHAWAESYVEGLGWVGFDPLMNRCPDERYVRLATGFERRDTAAVTGHGALALETEVSVLPSPELV